MRWRTSAVLGIFLKHLKSQSQLFAAVIGLQDRVSADPDDPEIMSLLQQLEVLGPAPRRLPMAHQQEMELWNRAEEVVAAGRVSEWLWQGACCCILP